MIRVFIVALASVFILNSCKKTSAEIEGEVRELWLQNLQKEQVTGVSVLDVSLVQKSDSLYTGILKTKEPEGTFLYNLEVTRAGDLWWLIPYNLFRLIDTFRIFQYFRFI